MIYRPSSTAGYENRSFQTARLMRSHVITPCTVSSSWVHVLSKSTCRGFSDIADARTVPPADQTCKRAKTRSTSATVRWIVSGNEDPVEVKRNGSSWLGPLRAPSERPATYLVVWGWPVECEGWGWWGRSGVGGTLVALAIATRNGLSWGLQGLQHVWTK